MRRSLFPFKPLPRAPDNSSMTGCTPTVLLVEDEPTIRELFKRHFERARFHVLEAADGVEGLALARTRRPDVIVADQTMPRMSGLKMLEELRAGAETLHVPFILATGTPRGCWDAQITEAIDILEKPFLLSDLIETVHRVLGVKG